MPKRSREDEALIAKSAALVIGQLENKLPEVSLAIQQRLFAEVSEIAAEGELLGLVYDSIQGNLDTFFPAIRHGISIDQLEPPVAAVEHARRLAQREVAADSLVRTYRLGHQAVVAIVLDEIRTMQLDSELALDVFDEITSMSFRYVDRMSLLVLAAYHQERDRWQANQNRIKALRIREVLEGVDVDVDETSNELHYPLRQTHIALILWCGESDNGGELVFMEKFAAELAKAAGSRARPLFIAADRVTGWAWMSLDADAAAEALKRIRGFIDTRPDAPWVAAGDPLPDICGFRRSHDKALSARAVVMASGSQPPALTAASDPGLIVAARFCADMPATRTWVADVLGPLASATDSDERMRETLRVFLRTGSSFKATADQLHLHVNSVKYRVQRAIERRGKSIADDRLDVEVALLLCHWFDTAVLN